MSLTSLRLKITALFLATFLAACGGGGGSAPPPTGGITATAGDGQVTITWVADAGVDYWLMYALTATAIDMKSPPGNHAWITSGVTSPLVITGLANGVTYSFAMNGRTNGGPGGAQTPSVSATPVAVAP
jgi:hypothetical protein